MIVCDKEGQEGPSRLAKETCKEVATEDSEGQPAALGGIGPGRVRSYDSSNRG
jgi:hypothetical protein